MKKWILLIWLFCVQLLAVHAENEYYTIFKVGSNICTPVTLKTPYGNYTIHTEITIPNSLSGSRHSTVREKNNGYRRKSFRRNR